MKMEKINDALLNLIKCINLSNNNFPEAYFQKSICLCKLNRKEEAILDLEKAIELNPFNYEYYYNKGKILMENEKFNLAIEEFQNSLENMNDNEINDIFYKLGFCALKINKFNDAIEYFENSIENVEKNTEKFFKESYELCKNGKSKEILLKSPSKIKELNNNLNEIYLYQAICYMNIMDYNKAIIKFNKCIEIDNKKSSNYYNKGICYTKLNKFKEANEMFEFAIKFDNDNKLYKQMYENNKKRLKENSNKKEKSNDLNKNENETIKKTLNFEHF